MRMERLSRVFIDTHHPKRRDCRPAQCQVNLTRHERHKNPNEELPMNTNDESTATESNLARAKHCLALIRDIAARGAYSEDPDDV